MPPRKPTDAPQQALSRLEQEALVKELASRQGAFASGVEDATDLRDDQDAAYLDEMHPKQRAFAVSKAKRKVARCGRRSGKTTALLYITKTFQRLYPGATIVYVTLTRDQAASNFWRPLKQMNARFRMGMEFNEQKLQATCPNGCVIKLVGAADSDQIEKLRGDKYPLVMIDEVASFKAHLAELVLDVLDAALGDYDGTLILAGSPKESSGFFFEACTGLAPGWETHHWNITDNSKFPRWTNKKTGQPVANWQDRAITFLAEKAKELGETSARFIREQLGEFYTDTDAQYFKFRPAMNAAETLPPGGWLYALGVDFGATDPTAFVVLAVSPHSAAMYVVYTYSKTNMLDTEIAQKIRDIEARWPVFKKVADFAGKQFVMSLNARYSLGLTAAKKGERLDQIEMLNSDFLTGRMKVLNSEVEFQGELTTVVWNAERTGPAPTRNVGHHADRHDALRYVWNSVIGMAGKLAGEPDAAAELVAELTPNSMDPFEAEVMERAKQSQENEYNYEEF